MKRTVGVLLRVDVTILQLLLLYLKKPLMPLHLKIPLLLLVTTVEVLSWMEVTALRLLHPLYLLKRELQLRLQPRRLISVLIPHLLMLSMDLELW
jgi:hypothetical protein